MELAQIQRIPGFGLGRFPFRYLGVPVLASRLNIVHYSPLINRIVDLMRGWSGKKLSFAGRLELIRGVIQGITSFWFSIFPMPATVIKHVSSLCRYFLWGKSPSSNYRPLVAWKLVCSPKEEGGLGLLSLTEWNLALLAGVIWEIQADKDSLWINGYTVFILEVAVFGTFGLHLWPHH